MFYFLLNNNTDLHMSSLGTLVLHGHYGVFYATKDQFAEANTWLGFLLVLWFDITHTQAKTHGTHRYQWTNTYKTYNFILMLPVMCSQQLHVLHWMNNFLFIELDATFADIENLLCSVPQFICFSKVTDLIYLLIRLNKTKLILWNKEYWKIWCK